MKSMESVLPWMVVMAGAGGAIWWMLGRDMTLGRWLFAAILLGHGLVHLLYAVPEPESSGQPWPFSMTDSWAGANAAGVGWVIIAVAIVGLALAALGTVGIAVPSSWWQPVLVIGAVASAMALVVFWNPQLVLGIGINVVLIWVAVSSVWTP